MSDSIACEATFETKRSALRPNWGETVTFAIHGRTLESDRLWRVRAWAHFRKLVKSPRSYKLTQMRVI
jgi:hypothetical protein